MPALSLPPFEIEKPVGRGGMGAVFLATDVRHRQQLALKLLRPEVSHFTDLHARFRRETRAVSALDHPNIVRVLEVGELTVPMDLLADLELEVPEEHRPTEQGAFHEPPPTRQMPTGESVILPYIAMEWLPGRDLGELIEERPGLERCLHIAGQILEALSAAHACGIVHRDLKPANVRITPDGQVKLLDFGLAKLLPGSRERDTTSHLTLEGTIMGTLPYLAPEQLRGEHVGPSADLFAFGVLFYELLVGSPPYPGDTMVAYARALLTGPPPSLREADPECPPWLDELLARLIAVDPDDRLESAEQARAAILKEQRPAPAKAASERKPLPRWLLAVLAAALAILLTFAWLGGGTNDDQDGISTFHRDPTTYGADSTSP